MANPMARFIPREDFGNVICSLLILSFYVQKVWVLFYRKGNGIGVLLACLLQEEGRGSIISFLRITICFSTKQTEMSGPIFKMEIYERASRQKLNKEKTSLFFSKNTPEETKASILELVGVAST
jgi:hypothetical protein